MAKMKPLDVAIESMTFVAETQGPGEPVPAPTDDQLAEAQKILGHPLPPAYVDFMQRAGTVLMPDWDLYWVGDCHMTQLRNIVIANELEREHETSPLPEFLIAFCDDGNGDQYCFDTRPRPEHAEGSADEAFDLDGPDGEATPETETAHNYPVVLWDRDQGLAQIEDGLYVVATDFVDWLKGQVHESV
ncbi:MAG: SMI1/KNR4 family protein [Planctomycetota bacterium]